MIPPDEADRKKLRAERIWFVRRSAEWVRSVPNEVWSRRQCEFINSQFLNKKQYPLTKEQYLSMIEEARSLSSRKKGSPPLLKRYNG